MRHKKEVPTHIVDFLFALSLFFVFTASAFFVVLIGANVYQSTVLHLEDTYSTRTSLAYVAEKIRQHDSTGSIHITSLDGQPALRFTDTQDGSAYDTYIYSDGSHILELTARQGTEVSSDMGEQILDADSFSFSEKAEGFLELSVKDTRGRTQSVLLHLRSSGTTA